MNKSDYEDRELIEQFLTGDEQSFNILVRKNQDFVYNIAFKLLGNHDDAQEAAQRVFVKVYEQVSTFSFRSAFTTWLYRIVTNESLNMLRSRRARRWLGLGEISPDRYESTSNPHSEYIEKEEHSLIMETLTKLPPRQRAVFVLRIMEGLSYEEISVILNVSIGSLKASFHHAVKKLGKYLERKNE